MRDDRLQHVAAMLLARRWASESDFNDEATDTFVEWPPSPPQPATRMPRGTIPPEPEYEDELEYTYELDYE